MEKVLEDVTKVCEQVGKALGHDKGLDPNQIFVRLEELLGEESSVRVNKVARSIICMLEPPRTRLKNDEEDDSKKNDMKHIRGSQNDDIDEMGGEIIHAASSKHGMRENDVTIQKESGLEIDSSRSTRASVISITDEER